MSHRGKDIEAEGMKIADAFACPVCDAQPGEPCLRTNETPRPYWLVHYDRREASK